MNNVLGKSLNQIVSESKIPPEIVIRKKRRPRLPKSEGKSWVRWWVNTSPKTPEIAKAIAEKLNIGIGEVVDLAIKNLEKSINNHD